MMRKCRVIKVLLWLIAIVMVPYLYIEITFTVRYLFRHANTSSSCIIPSLNPYDPSIMKYVWDPKPLTCDTSTNILTVDNHGLVIFNKSALALLKLSMNQVSCTYSILRRQNDDVSVKFDEPITLSPPTRVNADFFYTECSIDGKLIFDKILTNVAKESVHRTTPLLEESAHHLSVVMFGVDSVSRSASIRKLPKTNRYLREELGSYDFKGYMKVGENTLPNLTPLLTGRRVWTSEVPIKDYTTDPFDPFPFLWRNFSERGAATLYAEDYPEIGTFNYLTRGFVRPPADHYMRPFWLGLIDRERMRNKLGPIFLYLENKNVNLQGGGSTLCYKDRPKHVVLIDYLKQFLITYKNKRKMMLSFLVEFSHEYPNFLSYGDDDFLEFLKWMKTNGHLDNTVLVFFSDHGSRIDKIRNTFVGRIEDRMPMLHMVIPDHIKSKFPNVDTSLKINLNRLTTPFDVHQTMIDVLNSDFETPTKSFIDGTVRSLSLFKSIPEGRSCTDAWVPENYCACYTFTPVNASDETAKTLAEAVIRDLNKRLAVEPQCATLALDRVTDVRHVLSGLQHMETENKGISLMQFFRPEDRALQRYDLTIETVPGHGAFEATYHVTSGSEFRLVGDIVRVNKYGSQSACITDKLLRPLCYCKAQ
ncbi:hypothetical protein MAR_024645 [Mya arenaria]|uniref:Uncharacterized protein n=1 Tax=Mya arenaria TaxID=6604 RepID=A0ABY7DRF1_MYAAR|nr:uncharacterized protein LOC128228723 [Mya arenaria]WAR00273.1 hypothetical protein MAR_024645 [Mya arenaria]